MEPKSHYTAAYDALARRIFGKWIPQEGSQFVTWVCERFGFKDLEEVNARDLEERYRMSMEELHQFMKVGYEDWITRHYDDFQRTREMICRAHELLDSYLSCVGIATADEPVLHAHRINEVLDPTQRIILHVLRQLGAKGLRRYRGMCYRQIVTKDGDETRAWEPCCSISEFVTTSCQKESYPLHWSALTKTGSSVRRETVQYLEECSDIEFRDLLPDRHVFAFRNGIYDAASLRFHPFDDEKIPETLTACGYSDGRFPIELQDADDWYRDIPTPHFQSILDAQRFGSDDEEREAVNRWVYALMGRFLYDEGEMDSWKVRLLLRGLPGCGRSTTAGQVERIYGPGRTLLFRGQGDPPPSDEFLFVCRRSPSAGLGSDLKPLVTGQRSVDLPGLFVEGDDLQGLEEWLVTLEFFRKVVDRDPGLSAKLRDEMPHWLLKVNRAYRDEVGRSGRTDFWKIQTLPDYFRRTRRNLRIAVNPMMAFVEDKSLFVLRKDASMPVDTFVRRYREWLGTNRHDAIEFTADRAKHHCDAVFEHYGIRRSLASADPGVLYGIEEVKEDRS